MDRRGLGLKTRFLMARSSQMANFAPNRYMSGILHGGIRRQMSEAGCRTSEDTPVKYAPLRLRLFHGAGKSDVGKIIAYIIGNIFEKIEFFL